MRERTGERAREAAGTSRAPGAWTDEELVDGLTTGDGDAIRELNARYGPLLLRQAKRRGLGPAERREFVGDVLTDVVLRLMEPAAARPVRLRGYLVATVDRRLIDRHRRLLAAPPTVALDEPGGTQVARAGDDEDPRDTGASTAARALATALEHAMDEADRELLLWLGERIPQRVIAEWLQMTDGALRTYVSRLRRRLREAARAHVAALPERERAAVARYFERFPAAPAATAPGMARGTTRGTTRRMPTGRRHDTST